MKLSSHVKNIIATAMLAVLFTPLHGQNEISLRIGDPAPSIKYSKWIKGEPVDAFQGDQLYVLEFWATWCGPCKAAMPHLTKTQKEYGDKIRIIGVDVWEKVEENEKYESTIPFVEKFVKGNDANMGYAVVADNNDQHMGNNWLKAAGQNGIPSTFIVKNEQIIWIGHPIKLDSILAVIMDGTYNMQAYKSDFEKRGEASRKQMAAMSAGSKKVRDALEAKDYNKAFALMEEVKVEVPILKISMDDLKFKTLLKHVSVEEAKAFAVEWAKEFKSAPAYVLQTIAGEKEISKSLYLWAVKNFESSNTAPVNPMLYNLIASVCAKGGDFQNAIANQEKAIEGAKTALKEGKLIGSIMDYTVTEYEEQLAEYKKSGKVATKSK